MADAPEKEQPIIIKKIIQAGGHHGGAWKVAYADFVTAMMAFFLLLWLLNVVTDEQKNAISNYFDATHPKVSEASSGAGGVMGGLSMTPEGAMATTVQQIAQPQSAHAPSMPAKADKGAFEKPSDKKTKEQKEKEDLEKAKEKLRKQEEEKFKEVEKQIKLAIAQDPGLASLAKNLIIDMTPEGLRIQIVDEKGESMFPSGSAEMYDKMRMLIGKMSGVIEKMPNEISIRGHTDSSPYGANAKYTNWELSSDRANASRRVLLESGYPTKRINNVVGKADTEHLVKNDPSSPRNRRISIILLREELTNPDFGKKDTAAGSAGDDTGSSESSSAPQVRIGTFRKTPGQVQFP
ncbi:MAG: flagellar motor protein MotB [Alphaproteobacteria bacterium]|nr:flagellar motor protein MotB [Alphaproteobacteria bacterium]